MAEGLARLDGLVVLRNLATAAEHLSGIQQSRLQSLAGLIGPGRQIPLAAALDVAAPSGDEQLRQAAFRKFREAVNEAFKSAGVSMQLEVDRLRAAPGKRWCWFASQIAENVAEISANETRDVHPLRQVPPTVAEVVPASPILVYVIAASQPAKSPVVDDFTKRLRDRVAVQRNPEIRVLCSRDVHIGDSLKGSPDERLMRADVVVTLVDVDLLQPGEPEGHRIQDLGADAPIVIKLAELPPLIDHPLLGPWAFLRASAYADTRGKDRDLYVDDVIREIVRRYRGPRTNGLDLQSHLDSVDIADRVADLARRAAARGLDLHRLVESRLAETTWAVEAGQAVRPVSVPMPAVDRLVKWSCDASDRAPSHCALLGDTGMGKTTTAKLLTQRLLELRNRSGKGAVPVPIYLDLRDLPIAGPDGGAGYSPGDNLEQIIDLLLRALDVSGYRPTAHELIQLVRTTRCILIVDGLDEVLVHLSARDRSRFTNTLWRAIERPASTGRQVGLSGADVADSSPPPSKLLLSCRTHYFRSVREEAAHFTGQDRDGPRRLGYLTLLMLPFNQEQIRTYLAENVPGSDPDTLIELLSTVHNLRELAERPYTLSLISEQLHVIERAKLESRSFRPVDLYGEFVRRWLERDEGKHVLIPEHKLSLMEHLAASVWRTGRTAWTAADIDDWLVARVTKTAEMVVHYAEHADRETWKADFRTASFVVRRDDDSFAFAHTSLREYFLARYLAAALLLDPRRLAEVSNRWAMPVPSRETLDFLGQLLAGMPENERVRSLATLRSLRGVYRPLTSELVFAYGIRAHVSDLPAHALTGSVLDGADLRGWVVSGPASDTFDLRGISLRDAKARGLRLTRSDLRNADLEGADLSDSEIIGCDLRGTSVTGADLTGARIRGSRIDTLPADDVYAYRTQLVDCDLVADPPTDPVAWLIAGGKRGGAAVETPPIPADASLRVLTGHVGGVLSGCFSPDGRVLATTGADGSVRLWDPATGELLRVLVGHTGSVSSGCFSPDGRVLATTGGDDRSVRLWNPATGKLLRVLTGHTRPVMSGCFSPDGRVLATTGWGGSVRLWDPATGEPLRVLTGHSGSVRSGCFSPDGRVLATTGGDGSVRLWDPATGKLLRLLAEHTGAVMSACFSPDGRVLATTGGDDRSVRLWDPATGKLLRLLAEHTAVMSACFSPDGRVLATTSGAGSVRLWDPATAELLRVVAGHTGAVLSGCFSPDGRVLATTGGDGSVRLWDPATGEPLQMLPQHSGSVLSACFSPDGRVLATTGGDGSVRLWDSATGELVRVLTERTGSVMSACFSSDGRVLATASGRSVRLWDPVTGDVVRVLTEHTDWLRSGCFSPDGRVLATIDGDDRSVRLWDPATGELLRVLTEHVGSVLSACFSPDGRVLATIDGRWVRLWDPVTGKLLRVLVGHTGSVLSGCFSPDGRVLATAGGDDRSVRLWDPATGKLLRVLTGHTRSVLSGCFSPDGRVLATTGSDGSVRLWDPATGETLQVLTEHTGSVLSGCFSPDGRLATTDSRSVRLWDPATGQLSGIQIDYLPGGQHAVSRMPGRDVINATENAWRWLGWSTSLEGRPWRLPAETFGPLPTTPRCNTPV